MSAWSPEELRRAALEAMGEYANPRARDALQRGELTIAPGVSRWEGSEGRVEAHRVTLALDAEQLGSMRGSHAAVDALDAALAKAVARHRGQTLQGVELRWARGGARAVARGYRDAPPVGEGTLREALVAYLEGAGEAALARVVARGQVATEPGRVRIVLQRDQRAQLDAHEHAISTLTSALRDLLAAHGITVILES